MIKEKLIDLDDKQFKLLKEILESYISGKMVWAYGSRVAWKAQETSDLDLVVFDCNSSEIFELKEAMEESDLLVTVDIMDWESIPKDSKENIKKKYVTVQEKASKYTWQMVKLGDVVTLNYGKALKTQDRIKGNSPVFSSAGIVDFHNNPLVNSEGIIIGRKGTVGKIYYSKTPFWCIDTAYYILPNNKKYDIHFLFYLLQTLGLDDLNEDSAVPGLNRKTAYHQKILLPPLHQQKTIAEILSSLDDKIDLLHRQNKILENLAQTLFCKWFIEDADDSWSTVSLGNSILSKVLNSGINWFVGEKTYLATRDVQENSTIKKGVEITFNDRPSRANMQPVKFSVWFAKKGGVRKILMFDDFSKRNTSQTILSTGFSGLKTTETSHYYIWCFIYSQRFQDIKNSLISGTVQPDINNNSVTKISIPCPNLDDLTRFNNIAKPIFKKYQLNQLQSDVLKNLHKILLVKLVNGTIEVRP